MHLAADDPSRVDEAADGLELVARAATRADDAEALRAAVLGLETIAPARPIGRHALALARNGRVGSADQLAILPAALAAAPDQAATDSLLLAWGTAMQATGSCEPAAQAFRAVRRHPAPPPLQEAAGRGLGTCALRLGRASLAAGNTDVARRWFGEAVALDSTSANGLAALMALAALDSISPSGPPPEERP